MSILMCDGVVVTPADESIVVHVCIVPMPSTSSFFSPRQTLWKFTRLRMALGMESEEVQSNVCTVHDGAFLKMFSSNSHWMTKRQQQA